MSIHTLVGIEFNSNLDEIAGIISQLQSKSRNEAGCALYTFTKIVGVEGQFRFIELWKNNEALTSHDNSDHFATLVPKLVELTKINYIKKTIASDKNSLSLPAPTKNDIYLVVYLIVEDKSQFGIYADEITLFSRQEAGCLYYSHAELDGSMEDGSNWVFVEKWLSEESLEFHRNSEHCKRLIPLLDSVSKVTLVEQSKEVF